MHSRKRQGGIRPRVRPRFGFTLAELSIVTLLISLMATVAVPRYLTALKNYQAESAANRIKLDLELTRQAARKASTSRSIVFDSTNQSYSMASVSDVDRPTRSTYVVKLTQSPYNAVLSTVNCGGDATLVFDGFGKPDSAATIVVMSGPATRTITVETTAGKVSVQ